MYLACNRKFHKFSRNAMRVARLSWLVALPLLAWLVARIVLVTPARRSLALAQHTLLVAEREEMAAEANLQRTERTVDRAKRRLKTMIADAERLRTAEQTAKLQLKSLEARASGPKHWILPGGGRRRTKE